ncbi:MAG: hypothetical protein DUD26_05360 [Eubacteriaceae bacterium]|nr:MAG: hypothetical protein DUD26_05360 [Eubacteriaceae bacterium]
MIQVLIHQMIVLLIRVPIHPMAALLIRVPIHQMIALQIIVHMILKGMMGITTKVSTMQIMTDTLMAMVDQLNNNLKI